MRGTGESRGSEWSGLCTRPGADRCWEIKCETSTCWSGQRGRAGLGRLARSKVRAAGGPSRQERTSEGVWEKRSAQQPLAG